ncbi:DUF2283 domain-containing protein [Streptomyces gobitricini]|uniref:DUF2283 domain-containing protein n=1 Tax=Streptomyces gobitricini TaxID=68211 RepID=A0ABN3N5L5_9ACTN
MQITHDRENDTAYVSLAARVPDGAAVRQVTVAGPGGGTELTLDFDGAGRLLGIEVLGARAGLTAEVLGPAGSDGRGSTGPDGRGSTGPDGRGAAGSS